MRPKKRILLVGVDEARISILRFVLETHAFAVTSALSSIEAAVRIRNAEWDVLICDWPLPEGLWLIEQTRLQSRSVPVLVLAHSMNVRPEGIDELGLAVNVLTRINSSSSALLEYAKLMTAHKRGPVKGWKKAPQSVLRAELEERFTA